MIEIKRKPVDKRAKAELLARAIISNAIGPYERIKESEWADKIDSIYNSKEEDGEIEEIRYEGQDTGVAVKADKPFATIETFDRKNGAGYPIVVGRKDLLDFANALLRMCEQME